MAIPLLLWGLGAAAAGLATAAGVSVAKDMKRKKELEREREREKLMREQQALEQRKTAARTALLQYIHSGMNTLYSVHANNQFHSKINISFSQLRELLEEMENHHRPASWMLRHLDSEIASDTAVKARQEIANLQAELVALRRARESIALITSTRHCDEA